MAEGVKRKISAILSADVVGYSKLMEADEEATVRTMESYRKTITSLIEQHDGRVIDSPGDNLLSEFGSVVDAVQCAVEVQHVIKAKNAGLPETRKMEFRIGINLGDVIQEEGRTYGEGINIAARIEGLADAGGICISDSAYQQIETKLALGYVDLGEHDVKNISRPVRVYRIPMDSGDGAGAGSARSAGDRKWRNVALALIAVIVVVAGLTVTRNHILKPSPSQEIAKTETATAPAEKAEPSLSEKPSIAVLPFDNMSGDPEQEYFVDGMTEEIITRLSMNTSISVISRNSTFTYKGKQAKTPTVGEELGVGYVVEGSVRRSDGRIRVTAQLIETASDNHVWAKTYDKNVEDVFAIQDEIAGQIVAALNVKLSDAEIRRVKRSPTHNPTANDLLWKGIEQFRLGLHANAQAHFQRAIAQDSDCADCYAFLGWSYFWDGTFNPSGDSRSLDEIFDLAQKSTALDRDLPIAHRLLSRVHLQRGETDIAIIEAKKALETNPNDVQAYFDLGMAYNYGYQPSKAIEVFDRASLLNPKYPEQNSMLYGISYRMLGQYGNAIEAQQKAVPQIPWNSYPHHEISISYLGQWITQQSQDPRTLDLALEYSEKALEMHQSDWGLAGLVETYMWKKQIDIAIERTEKALVAAPLNHRLRLLLGAALTNFGRFSEAVNTLEAFLAEGKPGHVGKAMYLRLLSTAYRHIGEYEKALQTGKQQLSIDLNHLNAYLSHIEMAILYIGIGRIEEAKTEAEEVLKLAPNFSVGVWVDRNPMKDRAQVERDMAALRKAGLK